MRIFILFYTDQYAFSLFPIWARFNQNLDAKGKSIIFGGKAWFGYVPGGIIQSNIPAYNWAWSMYVCAKQARPKALNKTISADVL